MEAGLMLSPVIFTLNIKESVHFRPPKATAVARGRAIAAEAQPTDSHRRPCLAKSAASLRFLEH